MFRICTVTRGSRALRARSHLGSLWCVPHVAAQTNYSSGKSSRTIKNAWRNRVALLKLISLNVICNTLFHVRLECMLSVLLYVIRGPHIYSLDRCAWTIAPIALTATVPCTGDLCWDMEFCIYRKHSILWGRHFYCVCVLRLSRYAKSTIRFNFRF